MDRMVATTAAAAAAANRVAKLIAVKRLCGHLVI